MGAGGQRLGSHRSWAGGEPGTGVEGRRQALAGPQRAAHSPGARSSKLHHSGNDSVRIIQAPASPYSRLPTFLVISELLSAGGGIAKELEANLDNLKLTSAV